jgi:hypothetical protein
LFRSWSRQEEIRKLKAAINERRANLQVSINNASCKRDPRVVLFQLATSVGARFLMEDLHRRMVISPSVPNMENEVSIIYVKGKYIIDEFRLLVYFC